MFVWDVYTLWVGLKSITACSSVVGCWNIWELVLLSKCRGKKATNACMKGYKSLYFIIYTSYISYWFCLCFSLSTPHETTDGKYLLLLFACANICMRMCVVYWNKYFTLYGMFKTWGLCICLCVCLCARSLLETGILYSTSYVMFMTWGLSYTWYVCVFSWNRCPIFHILWDVHDMGPLVTVYVYVCVFLKQVSCIPHLMRCSWHEASRIKCRRAFYLCGSSHDSLLFFFFQIIPQRSATFLISRYL